MGTAVTPRGHPRDPAVTPRAQPGPGSAAPAPRSLWRPLVAEPGQCPGGVGLLWELPSSNINLGNGNGAICRLLQWFKLTTVRTTQRDVSITSHRLTGLEKANPEPTRAVLTAAGFRPAGWFTNSQRTGLLFSTLWPTFLDQDQRGKGQRVSMKKPVQGHHHLF